MAEVPISHIEKLWKLMEKADTTQDKMQELCTTWYQTRVAAKHFEFSWQRLNDSVVYR